METIEIEIIKPAHGSQKAIAAACGCSVPTVSEILSGSTRYDKVLTRKVKHVAMTQYKGKKYIKPQLKEV
ncbi:MAG: hypothetical protein ACK5L5_03580 [Bacteroidales bacterium]